MKNRLILVLCSLVLFSSCEKTSDIETVQLNSVDGLVEKGPFISGSSVSIYELDKDLNGTGNVFNTTTDNEGAFSINTSASLVSPYIKLSVNGYYFNEFTGKLSVAPIILESLVDISQTDNAKINVNILTHLEIPRVLKLVSDGLGLQEAKQQAQKELLSAFLITDKTVQPEQISITGNNVSANILIAISSILLNGRTDAQFSEFMSEIRNDLADGTISENTKNKIAESSLGLNYSQIKEHIINRYAELGKTVEVGAFELFIDGDGDGEIGDSYDEDIPNIVIPEDFFQTEENVKVALNSFVGQMYSFIQNLYLFDAVYTRSIAENDIVRSNELQRVYNHNFTPDMNLIKDLWNTAYRAISQFNILIDKLGVSDKDWATKYVLYAKTYRAYLYLNMTGLWGDVPLVIVPPSMDNLYYSRTSQNAILDFIISELNNVYSVLPEEATGAECSKYFAKAVQARAYLHKKDFHNASNCALSLINSNKFTLDNNADIIYTGNSNEGILVLSNNEQYSSISYRNLIQKGIYIPVARYAEILMMAAESSYQTGNTAQSLLYLNQIRSRQGLENTSSVTEELVLSAWENELQNEGLWFFTLKRFGQAMQTLNVPEYQLLLPIPISEINSNPKMTQNPGW